MKHKAIFVKKLMPRKEWKEWYEKDPTYCNLGEVGFGREKKLKVAFVVVDYIPQECEKLTDEELVQLDNYYRGVNAVPRPLKDL
ncbi:MAG: hypothetical protein AB1414_01175 [bacterium]